MLTKIIDGWWLNLAMINFFALNKEKDECIYELRDGKSNYYFASYENGLILEKKLEEFYAE